MKKIKKQFYLLILMSLPLLLITNVLTSNTTTKISHSMAIKVVEITETNDGENRILAFDFKESSLLERYITNTTKSGLMSGRLVQIHASLNDCSFDINQEKCTATFDNSVTDEELDAFFSLLKIQEYTIVQGD